MSKDRRFEELDSLFEDAPCGYLVFDEEGVITRANRTLSRFLNTEHKALVGTRFPMLLNIGSRLFYETHLHPLLVVNGELNEVALDLASAEGLDLPVLLSVRESTRTTVIADESEPRNTNQGSKSGRSFRAVILSVTERRRIEDDLREARQLAERQAGRLAGLYHVSNRLADAASPDAVAEAVATSAQEVLEVSSVVLWRLDANGMELHQISGIDAEGKVLDSLAPLDRSAIGPHWEAIDTNSTVVEVTESDRGGVAELAIGAGNYRVYFIPFQIGSNPGGVVSMSFSDSEPLDPDDVALLGEVVAQAATALERAELYALQREISDSWQRSLSAHDMPSDDRVEIRSFFAPATTGVSIGGDWFDVMRLSEDRLGFTIGDVVGHGIASSAAMGQLRSAARALAKVGLNPTEVLEGLDRFAERTPGTKFATVLCGDLDLSTGRVRLARAGHVPPAIVSAGQVQFIDEGAGPPLTMPSNGRSGYFETVFAPNDRLVLYTDGLIERRDEIIDTGMARLADLLLGVSERSLAEVVTELATSAHEDDVSLLELSLLRERNT